MLYSAMTQAGTSTVRCDFLMTVECGKPFSFCTAIFWVIISFVTCVCFTISSPKSILSYTRLTYSSSTKFLGITFDVLMVNCASAESWTIVEDRKMQCSRPFKMLIRLEQPVICRIAIANASDLGVWISPLLETLIRSWQIEKIFTACLSLTSTYSDASGSSENPRSHATKLKRIGVTNFLTHSPVMSDEIGGQFSYQVCVLERKMFRNVHARNVINLFQCGHLFVVL